MDSAPLNSTNRVVLSGLLSGLLFGHHPLFPFTSQEALASGGHGSVDYPIHGARVGTSDFAGHGFGWIFFLLGHGVGSRVVKRQSGCEDLVYKSV